MACNISYKDGKINVLDDSGNPSKLYKDAVDKFGEEKGLEIYLVSKSNSFLDFFAPKNYTNNNNLENDKTRFRNRTRWNSSRGNQTLEGAPIITTRENVTGADPELTYWAEEYARRNGIDYKRQSVYVEVDEQRAKRIAQAYEEMEHNPQDPKVKEAYQNLINQTVKQYEMLVEAGYQFYFFDETNDPYNGSPWAAMEELRTKKMMGSFATEAGFGSGATDLNIEDNPMLKDTGFEWGFGSLDGQKKRVLANDLFRCVHDAFGHGLEGAGFRARGEENAWQSHARLFTGSAVAAITSETRGQNSWLNYGKYGEQNQTAKVEDTIFADQKTGLMPEWTWKEGFDEGVEEFRQEPTLQEVTNYVASNNRTEAELNQNQKADLINVLISNPDFKAEDFYDEFGMFVIPKKHYSRYELLTLENEEQIKEAIDALTNTENFTPSVEVEGNVEQVNEKNAFGKLVNLNPIIAEKEKLREEVLNGEREDYKTAEVFIETLDGELISAKNTETEQILPLVVKETFRTDLIDSVQNISLNTLQQGEEQTRVVLKAIENDLISQGIDAVGLSEKTIDEELVDFLNTAKTFINSPTKENTKTFTEKSDIYFERDLEPKVDVVKSDKTDRNYVRLNTNLTEEQLYEKKGLIQSELGKGIYIQTASESLEDLYNNLRTYTEKYPKRTTLEQYVQKQIADMNYDNAENAEAIVLYKMYFNVNNKENENKQLSPTEEQGRSTAGRIAEEATNILRGSGRTISKNTSREEQINKLRVWSYDNGYYIEDYEKLGEFKDKGMESQVYYNSENDSVIKVNDLEFYDTPLEYFNSIAVHNQLFPEAPYVVKGFTTRQDTFEFAVIVEQPFIRAERGATNLEVFEELSKMGYSKIGENMYTNGRYTIEDLHEGNILVDKNSNLFFIDPVVRINTENNTIRSVQKQFTGNYNYLTEDYVSDFYIEQLKEKQKNSAKYRNFYKNFEVNEKGINLLNTDDITMQQIEIYADDNLRQYSLLSKQMPDLKVDDINENQRDLTVNNPQTLEDYKKDLFRVNDNTIILKDNTETFVKVNGEIYENVETDSNLSVFAKIETPISDYFQYNIKQPKTNIKLSDYNYLATQEELFTSPKKYLKQEEKNQIKNDKFNC
jgi:hypothetical protein